MPFAPLVVAFIGWMAKVLGAKLALAAAVVASVIAVVAATKLGMMALLAAVPHVAIGASVMGAAQSLAPANLRDCVEILINSWVLRIIFESKWMFLKLYVDLMSFRVT